MTSEEQAPHPASPIVLRNRKNAKKSTGPKTAKGKAIAKLNATKHGILSRQVFIATGREIDETHESFLELKESFWDELQPVGIVEEILVDRIFSTVWRLKRFLMAESGYVERQVESHRFQSFLVQYEKFSIARQNPQTSFFARLKTSMGCREIARTMEHVARVIKEHGKFPLPDWVIGVLDKRLGAREGFLRTEALSILDYGFHHREENPISAEEEKQATEEAIGDAEALAQWFDVVAEVLEVDEKGEERAVLKTKMIPPSEELEKLQRYEAHLQRVFTQTLHELQRVQAARLGKPAPLSAALDVTLNSETGFVS